MYVHRCCRKTVHHLWHCLVKYNDKTRGHRGTTLLVSLRAPTVNFFFSDASALASVHFLHPNKAGSGIPDTLIQWNRFSVAPLGILIHFLFFSKAHFSIPPLSNPCPVPSLFLTFTALRSNRPQLENSSSHTSRRPLSSSLPTTLYFFFSPELTAGAACDQSVLTNLQRPTATWSVLQQLPGPSSLSTNSLSLQTLL